MKRLLVLCCALLAVLSHAQAPAPKIAITSLVGDTITVAVYRERVGTNLGNASSVIKMPGPLLDVELLKTAQQAVSKAVPGASAFPLKVPAAGSSVDPALVVADGKVSADNVLVDALRQQGFTHLVTATRHRNNNVVRLKNTTIGPGPGQLEGLGFYLDPTVRVQHVDSGELAEGIIAPYLYIKLTLVDLGTLQVRSTQTITENSVSSSVQNKDGVDPWGALTPAQKMDALQALIHRHVADAVPRLFEAK